MDIKMSFSMETKNEILDISIKKDCCNIAELLAIVCFAGSTGGTNRKQIKIVTESDGPLKRAAALIKRTFKITGGVISPAKTGKGGLCLALTYTDENSVAQILDGLKLKGRINDELIFRVEESFTTSLCCKKAFIRGAYLGGGFIVDPQKNYNLEFVTRHKSLCDSLCKLLLEFDISPKINIRKNNFVIYFKNSEEIETVLNIIGAHKAMMEITNVRIMKEKRNEANRRVNFETANIGKTVDAAQLQIRSIEKIINTIGIEALPDTLKEIALLRYDNPEASLSDLGKLLKVPISKSGVNHRLLKLAEIARERS